MCEAGDLANAIKDYYKCDDEKKLVSMRQIAKKHQVPFQTLQSAISRRKKRGDKEPNSKRLLLPLEEKMLVQWIMDRHRMCMPVDALQIKSEAKKIMTARDAIITCKTGAPGRHWFERFMSRNNLSTRRVSGIETARITALYPKVCMANELYSYNLYRLIGTCGTSCMNVCVA